MLRFVDGFDHYPLGDLLLKWTSAWFLSGAGSITTSNLSSYFAIVGTGRNSGSSALNLKGSSAGSNIQLRKTFADNQATWVVGAGVYFSAFPSTTTNLIRFLDGTTTQTEIQINSSGHLVWARNGTVLATGTTALSATTYYYIEVQVTISSSVSANTCILSVNGVAEITLAATTNTKNTGNAYAQTVELFCSSTTDVKFDDVYICDGTGSINKALLGDCRVECIRPSGAGTSTGWTPDSGSNYARVNETTEDGDTSYVSASGLTTLDTYAMGDLSSSPTSIFGIQTAITARKDDAGSRSIDAVLLISGTNYEGSSVSIGDTYSILTEIRELNPNGSVAWTGAVVNALEAGCKLVG